MAMTVADAEAWPRLRRAAGDEAGQVADVYLRARHHAAAAHTIPPIAHNDDDVRRWFTEVVLPEREVWVAEAEDGRIVGLLVLHGDEIDQLYLDPEWTKQGIGSRLVDRAKAERPHGLRLWAFQSNTGARRFYERHGFALTGWTDGTGNEERAPDLRYVWHPRTS